MNLCSTSSPTENQIYEHSFSDSNDSSPSIKNKSLGKNIRERLESVSKRKRDVFGRVIREKKNRNRSNYYRRNSSEEESSESSHKKNVRNKIYSDDEENQRKDETFHRLSKMMTFQQFVLTLPADLNETLIVQYYSEYKSNFSKTNLLDFFERFSKEDWFKEKYHPISFKKRQTELSELTKVRLEALEEFLTLDNDFEEKTLNLTYENNTNVLEFLKKVQSKVDKKLESKLKEVENQHWIEERSDIREMSHEKTLDEDKTESLDHSIEPIGFIKSVPSYVSWNDILECLKENGIPFLRFSLSSPIASRQFSRMGWIVFNSSVKNNEISVIEACRKVNGLIVKSKEFNDSEKHDDFILRCSVHRPNLHNRIRSYTIPDLERTYIDFDQLCSLCEHFNSIRNIPNDTYRSLASKRPSENDNSLNEMLKCVDRLVLYLRIVHCFCYFSSVLCDDVDELKQFCGDVYVRSSQSYQNRNWERFVDDSIKKILKPKLSLEDSKPLGYKDVDIEMNVFIEKKIEKIEKDKFKCAFCGKCFKGHEYVLKHIPYRHNNELESQKNDIRFYNMYIQDPNRPAFENIFQRLSGSNSIDTGVYFNPNYNLPRNITDSRRFPHYSYPLNSYSQLSSPHYQPTFPNYYNRSGLTNSYRNNRGRGIKKNYSNRSFNGPRTQRPPPTGAYVDPRLPFLKRYVDLDAPPPEKNLIDYRDVIKYPEV